jgi:hypothetical protein
LFFVEFNCFAPIYDVKSRIILSKEELCDAKQVFPVGDFNNRNKTESDRYRHSSFGNCENSIVIL